MRSTRRPAGFTLIEVLVSMTITMVLGLAIFFFFTNLSSGMQRAQNELLALAAIRTATATLERQLRFMAAKSGYVPGTPPRFKALNEGMFRLQWPGATDHLAGYAHGQYQDGKCRYLGFYTTENGNTVDRVEYYFNPPEAALKCANGADDDFDDDPSDAANPLHLMRDDRGRLMLRRVMDEQMSLAQYHNQPPAGADAADAPPFPAYAAPRLTGAAGSEFDRGEVVAEGFSDVYFDFVYTRRDPSAAPVSALGKNFHFAARWPLSATPDKTEADETGERWPRDAADGKQPRGLSFIALPLAIRVHFLMPAGAQTRHYTHTLVLPQSQWHEYIRRTDR